MQLVHATFDQNEALLVRTQLERQGLHPFVQGANQGSLSPSAGLIELRVLVPANEVDRALRWLEGSTIVLDQTEPTGESLADAVCPVHEQAAVATCSRCGTFLCGRC
ncbi:putative signal transducing protein, partial [Cytobacillus oceanisediminis]|uniref:putative signal transducing protein n=1 Tax=Cytobacillus oceanisediminis TaxID=665099 RepID=UPI00203DCE6E